MQDTLQIAKCEEQSLQAVRIEQTTGYFLNLMIFFKRLLKE